jgi:anti-sigma-K factor RskA
MDIKTYISSGIIEMYIMGLCTSEEKAELESLRVQYPELEKAITEYEVSFEQNLMNTAETIPASVDIALKKGLGELVQPAGMIYDFQAKYKKRNKIIYAVAAASLVLLCCSLFYNYKLYQLQQNTGAMLTKSRTLETLPPGDYKILNDPSITPIAMYGVGSHAICRCTMFWDKRTGKVYIILHHLPFSSDSKDYQLWAYVNGKAVSVGIVKDEIRGRFIEMQNIPAGAISFSITLENAGGALTPTESEAYLRGKI